MKRLFAFLGVLLLLKVFFQTGKDFEVAEGVVLNVVIDFLHGMLDLLGCLGGSSDDALAHAQDTHEGGHHTLLRHLILGEPLYISCLVQGKNPPIDIVVGNMGWLYELNKI